ncbi:type II toxin-antitoxin system HicB family antitoxin [Novispirillum sp. DQ9]|uniref:type II toxin-antitoxin system HicB family antitoxin n=1 Tax=Novispirillum sp. DQ9 TaxID=3398612 RepID=UPI003C7CEDF9
MSLEYNGYTAGPIDFDEETGTFSGVVIGLNDVIHFEGSTAEELVTAFRGSIDEYLAFCAERGREPDKPYSGKILLRTDPTLHRKAAQAAAREGLSLNQWLARRIEDAA